MSKYIQYLVAQFKIKNIYPIVDRKLKARARHSHTAWWAIEVSHFCLIFTPAYDKIKKPPFISH